MKSATRQLINLTPAPWNRSLLRCPTIFADGDHFLVVGEALTSPPAAVSKRVGAGEIAIRIPRGLLANVSAFVQAANGQEEQRCRPSG